jgi:UDP-2-acetamido-3-amino-2,3-dideoxy-glucuronate N-acetyltransferase
MQNNVTVYKGATLYDVMFCGPPMVFPYVFIPRADIRQMDRPWQTIVRQGATNGVNATNVCGVTPKGHCFIGTGAAAARDAPDHPRWSVSSQYPSGGCVNSVSVSQWIFSA